MGTDLRTVVGLGEVLWDVLPQGKQLGGAPTNFAYMSNLLGHHAVAASAIGNDALGEELLGCLKELHLDTTFVQVSREHSTGTVNVMLAPDGQPDYEIQKDVAWDFLAWTPEWQQVASRADVICFGTLAQRSALSRETIHAFLRASRPDAVRIFDVNLRQNFFSADVLAESLRLANVAKLNETELPVVIRILGLATDNAHDKNDVNNESTSAECLRRVFGLDLVCVTRGARGSLLVREGESDEHPGLNVDVVDSVGAGDAFTAALAHHVLCGSSLRVINQAANRMGAWVASQSGGTPRGDANVLAEIMSL